MPAMPHPDDPVRTLAWRHGRAELQRLGAMLAPVTFSLPGHADFQPMQVAPWADEPGADALPGILRRLRGDWPCVPFGTTERPANLPGDWTPREPGDAWGHGHAANHDWAWADHPTGTPEAPALTLTIEPPGPGPVARLTRQVQAVPDAPALDCTLTIEARAPAVLPVALHPTFRLDTGRVRLHLHPQAVHAYPVAAEPGRSRLRPGARFETLAAAPLGDGGHLDLTRYPLPSDTEELLQCEAPDGPVRLDHLDLGWSVTLDWDRTLLPDLMCWVSHRGRRHAPWNGRHLALGLEPVHGPFDLGRVADPPPGHPLARRRGLALTPGVPLVIRSRLSAAPLPAGA